MTSKVEIESAEDEEEKDVEHRLLNPRWYPMGVYRTEQTQDGILSPFTGLNLAIPIQNLVQLLSCL